MLSLATPTIPPVIALDDIEGPTTAELTTAIGQLERIGAHLVAVGHGRDPYSRRAAEAFRIAWTARTDRDGQPRGVATTVDWPAEAASWLKPATRLTAPDVDAWVICDTPISWAPMSRRLRDSTSWDPARTVALSGLCDPDTAPLAGPGVLDGLLGATASGDLWFIHHDQLIHHTPKASVHSLFPREPVEIAPGAVHVPDWLSLQQQQDLVAACREWATGPAPMRNTRMPNGGEMSVQTVCLGWHWTPYRYTRTAIDQDNAPISPFPQWLADLGRAAVTDAYGDVTAGDPYDPDAALINFYDEHAKLGLHQDKDEHSPAPVVSLSIGDTCTFRFGNTDNRGAPYTDVELRSGDLFVFGGPARLAYHGVIRRIQAGTADPATGLTGGRLNLTLRETGR